MCRLESKRQDAVDRARDLVALIGIFAGVAFGLFSLLRRGDLIGTEIISYELARNGPAFLLERLSYDCESPGTSRIHGGLLYHVLFWGWLHLGHGEGIMRAFTALFGLASLALLGWMARPLGRSTALALVGLCATSPMLLDWFTSARAYGLFFLLSVGSCGCLLALVHAPSPLRAVRWAGLYLLCVVGLLYTHHFAIHLLAAHAVFALLLAVADRGRIGRASMSWAAIALGTAAAAPLWPLLQLHRVSRHLVPQAIEPGRFFGLWFHYLRQSYLRILRQFDYFDLVDHVGLETTYVLLVAALTILGAVATWRRSRVLLALLAALFVVPVVVQTLAMAWTGHAIRGLRYYIYLVPALHLPWALLVEHLSARDARWRHPALPSAVLALGLSLNLVAAGYAYSNLTWDRNHDVAARDVIPDLQPWRMLTDWRALAEFVEERGREPRTLLTSTVKDALYLGYYFPDARRVVSVGEGDRGPTRGEDPASPVSHEVVACLGLPVSQITMGPPPQDDPVGTALAASMRRTERSAFGILHLVQWETRGRPEACGGGPNLTMLDAHIGDRESLAVRVKDPGRVTLTLLARLTNEAPFTASVRVAMDGRPAEYHPIGASAALVYSLGFDVPSGTHEIAVEVVPMQEADPAACWSTRR